MGTRKIIRIDEGKCNGCGLCIPNCPEGAIQVINGKARLVSDLFCDGLGACIGHCPEGAIEVEEREAEPYDERKVMENIIRQGEDVVDAHLEHLRKHGEEKLLAQALSVLSEKGMSRPDRSPGAPVSCPSEGGCPGSIVVSRAAQEIAGEEAGERTSRLRQWPVQLHLVPVTAPFFSGSDVLVSADCVAYALADFHKDHLDGRSLVIACPKLDTGRDVYVEKIKGLIDVAGVDTITVMTMEVPCCAGLLALVREAAGSASRKVPIKHLVVGISGDIIKEEWV